MSTAGEVLGDHGPVEENYPHPALSVAIKTAEWLIEQAFKHGVHTPEHRSHLAEAKVWIRLAQSLSRPTKEGEGK